VESISQKKDIARARRIFFGVIVLAIIIATGLKIQIVSSDGVYHATEDQNTVVTYDETGPTTMYTVETHSSHQKVKYVTNYVYVPNEGQLVHLYQVHLKTTTRTKYCSLVIPKVVVVTKVSGTFDQVADDSGRSDWIGYIRNSPDRRYLIPADNNTPFYRTLSLGVLPEPGDQIKMYYLEIFFSSEKFLKLAILY